jgi:hypothetical protein
MDLSLVAHPQTPPRAVKSVTVQLHRERGLDLLYVVECDPARLVLPPLQKPHRADGLWQTTCFELFVRDGGQAYREFNFSPSSQWAAYGFRNYRAGRNPLALDEPPQAKLLPLEPNALRLRASIATALAPSARIGLSAIVEEADGTKSYWALAHPDGPPDFHHPDGFAIELPPQP